LREAVFASLKYVKRNFYAGKKGHKKGGTTAGAASFCALSLQRYSLKQKKIDMKWRIK
jgi:hypothetical protein